MLTDEQIEKLNYVTAERLDYEVFEIDQESVKAFARAIEAEVRKQDEALIRQMLEAIASVRRYGSDALSEWMISKLDDADQAARARLGEGGV